MTSASPHKRETLQRAEPRYATYRELAVTYEGHNEQIPVRAPDISAHGIFINTPKCFPEGAVLLVEFRLHHSELLVNARGEVRYCLPGVGVGVEFVDISPEARQAIEDEMAAVNGISC